MKQTKTTAICTLMLAGLLTGAMPTALAAGPTNIVIFIGDGMGFEHVQAGRLYKNGSDAQPLTFETLVYQGKAVTTLPNGAVTDSATAGTALATGYQHPANGVISMGTGNSIKTSILEMAKARGLRTGIITTDSISGATPGAFGAHEPDRTYEAAIRSDYLLDDATYGHAASRPNVLFGGGYNDPALISGPNMTYVAIANGLGYQFVQNASALDLLAPTEYALGLFGSSWAPMSSYVSGSTTQPRLPQMVNKALNLLQDNNGAGFFLMVEGALIDKLSHSNDRNFTPEVAQLDLAVQEALAWATQSGQSLLVIVTADHETGGVNVPDGQVITPGTIPTLTFSSTGHTAANVPVYANWPAGLQGQIIDNTEVFRIMEDALTGGTPPVITGLMISDITETSATVTWNTTELSSSEVLLSGITDPFINATRVTDHSLSCTGLQPGTTYAITAASTDLAGFAGTASTTFTTVALPVSLDAIVMANPTVTLGTLAGNYDGANVLNDGLTQSITEAPEGNGSGLQVEYTLHTTVPPGEVASLALCGAVSWTLKDGASDGLITEVRVAAPGGGYGWEQITLNAQVPFQAVPASSYLDDSGNIVIRFTDGAAIKRERKDTLTVDYLVGVIERASDPITDPSVPSDLTTTAASSTSVSLNWTDSDTETGYDIWRYNTAAGWGLAGSVAANTTTFLDTGLAASTTYSYVVRAFNTVSYSDSAIASATTQAPELEMPENLVAKVGRGVITLTWTDTNTGESGYQVLRCEAGGTLTPLATLAANTAKYADTAVTSGTTYQYQVRAILGSTLGPVSGVVTAKAR